MTDLIDTLDETIHQKKIGAHRFRSDLFKWVVLGLFIIALFFKNRHWPGAGIMMVACAVFSSFLIFGQLIEGIKHSNFVKALFGISIGLSIVYFIFRFQYWPGGTISLVFAILTSVTATILLGIRGKIRETNKLAIGLIFIGMFLFTLPKSEIFYYTNMSKTLNRWEHYNSSHAWGRYGDMLRAEGKEKEAAMAYLKSFDCASREEGGEVYKELMDDIMK